MKKSQLIILLSSLALLAGCRGGDTPSSDPSVNPSVAPSVTPSVNPSVTPSVEPSVNPSVNPSVEPSVNPSVDPSVEPSVNPSVDPSVDPSNDPSEEPTEPIINATYFYRNGDEDTFLRFYSDENEDRNVDYIEARDRRYYILHGTYSYVEDEVFKMNFQRYHETIDGTNFDYDFVLTKNVTLDEDFASCTLFGNDPLIYSRYTAYVPTEEDALSGNYVPARPDLGLLNRTYKFDFNNGSIISYLEFYVEDNEKVVDFSYIQPEFGSYSKIRCNYELISASNNQYRIYGEGGYTNEKGHIIENVNPIDVIATIETSNLTFSIGSGPVEFVAYDGEIVDEYLAVCNTSLYEDMDPEQYVPYDKNYLDCTYGFYYSDSGHKYYMTFKPDGSFIGDEQANGWWNQISGTYEIGDNNDLTFTYDLVERHVHGEEREHSPIVPHSCHAKIIDEDHIYIYDYAGGNIPTARYTGHIPTEQEVMDSYVDPEEPVVDFISASYIHKDLIDAEEPYVLDTIVVFNSEHDVVVFYIAKETFIELMGKYTLEDGVCECHLTYEHHNANGVAFNENVDFNFTFIYNGDTGILNNGEVDASCQLYNGNIPWESHVFSPDYEGTMVVPGPVMEFIVRNESYIDEQLLMTTYIEFKLDNTVNYYVVYEGMYHRSTGTYEGSDGEFAVTLTHGYTHQAGHTPVEADFEATNDLICYPTLVRYYSEDHTSYSIYNFFNGQIPSESEIIPE